MEVYQINRNLQYCGDIEIDYNIDYDCDNNGCNDEGICRCGVLTDIKVKKVNRSIVGSIVRKVKLRKNAKVKPDHLVIKDDQFFMYCIDRLFSINQLYDGDVWDVTACRGYYGEEIDSVSPPISFLEDVTKIASLNPQERISYVLTREYGYIHDRLKNKSFIEKTVSTKDLVVGNEYRKVEGKIYSCTECDLPIGIYSKDNSSNKYVLMDGYNRFYGIVPNMMRAVKIISAE